ncbi:MAG TPA: hypothetical protein PKI92_03465 [Candidatus Woesebacteria bacterium]|nr:hypothetical protein [Candidatus Woesebacteria bacterium]
MSRKYQVCSNPNCPRLTRTKNRFRSDAVDAISCPVCGTALVDASTVTLTKVTTTPPVPPTPPAPPVPPAPDKPENEGGKPMKNNNFLWLIAAIVAIVLAVMAYAYFDEQNDKIAALEKAQSTVAPAAYEGTAAGAENKTYNVTGNTTDGIDQPSKSWFIAKKGSLISGDVAIFDNDNNSRKLPVYDNKSETSDIIVVGQDGLYIWTEWGCHYWESPTQQDISGEITHKFSEGFTSIRKFDGLTRKNYSDLDPVIYNN